MRCSDSLHFAQIGHLGEGLRQLDHCARVRAKVGQVVVGEAAAREVRNKHQTGERRVSSWSNLQLTSEIAATSEATAC